MSLTVSQELIEASKDPALATYRDYAQDLRDDRELVIPTHDLGAEVLADLRRAALAVNDMKVARAIESITLARGGEFDKPVPSFKAFLGVLEQYLRFNMIDGWVYVTGSDGKPYPYLVTGITYDEGKNYNKRSGTPTITISTTAFGKARHSDDERVAMYTRNFTFTPQGVAKRRVADTLAEHEMFKETPALREAYMVSVKRHGEVTHGGFAKQFRVSGAAYQYEEDDYHRTGAQLTGRRVVHDLPSSGYGAVERFTESELFEGNGDGNGQVPEHPLVRVFDLVAHEFYWIHGDNLQPYVYDKSLRDKLVLPPTHRDLLDVLTSDIDAFSEDIIEGKSAGNVILCKGVPGVGKTLSAEVYSELVERPLYSIHSGTLGTTAEDIEKNLKVVFQRAKRWSAVCLLDEADVFVIERGNSIEQNAVTAVFLRTLEYQDLLLFMTTNRASDIDEAIIQRCVAIIDYAPPDEQGAAAIWRVMSTQNKVKLSEKLVGQLVAMFPDIVPRDIKMLFRLALRVSVARKEPLDAELFRRCAMFRAIKIRESGNDSAAGVA